MSGKHSCDTFTDRRRAAQLHDRAALEARRAQQRAGLDRARKLVDIERLAGDDAWR